MSSELVALLRQQSKIGPINVPRAAMREAAARIEALEAENARLREALEPFAVLDRDGTVPYHKNYVTLRLPTHYFHAARRAREGGNTDG